MVDLLNKLVANKCYVMTNEEGIEMYDKDGNLLLYEDTTGNCIAVPNVEEVRRLYDLSLDTPENKDTIDIENVGNRPIKRIPHEKSQLVWMNKHSEHSLNATKKLIELFGSPKYQMALNQQNTVKHKVWEEIACELQENGFKIADNPTIAGQRTFKKWSNMMRSYRKFAKLHPEGNVDFDQIDNKPYYLKDLHTVMVKCTKGSPSEINSLLGDDANDKSEEVITVGDDEIEIVDHNRPEVESVQQEQQSDTSDNDKMDFPPQALRLMTALVNSPKYDQFFRDPSNKLYPNRIIIWENIYKDMIKEGWKFGDSFREGALLLSEKWRLVEKNILGKKQDGPRTLYTPTLRKAVFMEIEKRNTQGPNYTCDPQSPDKVSSGNWRQKNGEIEPAAVEALLKLLVSGNYQSLLTTYRGKRTTVWEQIYENLVSQGFEIAGAKTHEKVTRLFQKWRNMKRSCVKYLIAKSKGKEVKKPPFYNLLFEIISREVLNTEDTADCDSDEDEILEEWIDDSECEDLTEYLELTHKKDHDYEADMNKEYSQSSYATEELQARPSTSRPSRSYRVLKQIKSLHESSLAMEQQNFSKIISLMEEQISSQNRLTTVVSEYISIQTNESNSRKCHRTRPY